MAITFVQAISAGNDSVTSTATSSGVDATAGNLLVVTAGYRDAKGSTAMSINDTAGNTFTLIGSELDHLGLTTLGLFYAKNIAHHASNIYTMSTGSDSHRLTGISVLEFSGASTTAPYDGVTATGTQASASPVTSTSFTPTTGDLVVAGGRSYNGTTLTAGSGYTIPSGASESFAARLSSEYQLGAGTGSQTASMGGDSIMTIIVACFVAAGGGGGGSRGLFEQGLMNGISTGGSFFPHPIG